MNSSSSYRVVVRPGFQRSLAAGSGSRGLRTEPFRTFTDHNGDQESTPSGEKYGNAFRHTYERMLEECPLAVCAYGACIQRNLRSLQKDACREQFQELKRCMHMVRKSSMETATNASFKR